MFAPLLEDLQDFGKTRGPVGYPLQPVSVVFSTFRPFCEVVEYTDFESRGIRSVVEGKGGKDDEISNSNIQIPDKVQASKNQITRGGRWSFVFWNFSRCCLLEFDFSLRRCPVPVQLLDEIRNAFAELQSATNLLVSQP